MASEREKELKRQYKEMKPDMGVFWIHPREGKTCYLQATPDFRGVMNGALVRLRGGMHPFRSLQKAWSELGEEAFCIEILEQLPYDKDEIKTDYSEDLELLRMIWEERLSEQGYSFYRKRE